jgi:hypothetical protein
VRPFSFLSAFLFGKRKADNRIQKKSPLALFKNALSKDRLIAEISFFIRYSLASIAYADFLPPRRKNQHSAIYFLLFIIGGLIL